MTAGASRRWLGGLMVIAALCTAVVAGGGAPESEASPTATDLQPSMLLPVPGVVDLGESVPLAAVARNWGGRSARASSVGWYMTPMKYLNDLGPLPNRHNLRVATTRLGALPGGGIDWPTATVTIPAGLTRGSFYGFMVCFDIGRSVRESSKANNCVASPLPTWVAAQAIS